MILSNFNINIDIYNAKRCKHYNIYYNIYYKLKIKLYTQNMENSPIKTYKYDIFRPNLVLKYFTNNESFQKYTVNNNYTHEFLRNPNYVYNKYLKKKLI